MTEDEYRQRHAAADRNQAMASEIWAADANQWKRQCGEEHRDTVRMLAAICYSRGGEFRLSDLDMANVRASDRVESFEDKANRCVVFRLVRKEEMAGHRSPVIPGQGGLHGDRPDVPVSPPPGEPTDE